MSTETEAPALSAAVRELIAGRPVFDAHADSIGRALDLGHDLGLAGELGHLDLVRGQAGGLGAWVVVCWVDPARFLGSPARRASAMFDAAHALAERHPTRFRIARNGLELEAARSAGCVAGILGIEGGHAIEESLDQLRSFFERGLRVMTLVWNNHLSWIRSCQAGADASVPVGLSEFGRSVVREMNRLGIVVDLSHAGERSFHDALDVCTEPPIASHSGCHALHAHPRNLTDEQLRALAARGGVVGIVFHPGFLSAEAREEEARVRASSAYRDLVAADPAQLFIEQQRVMRTHARPMPAQLVVDHIVHAIKVMGVEHVGLGSDYDGIERGPEWMEDARGYAVLAELLVQHGLSIAEVGLVLGGNMRRVFDAATAATQ